ncbi:MAG: hypothetical protein ONB30_14160 [candidate division KSB1 bacterium]|nr:hypothetical protein [candidate division KSB1 bacterium]
MRKGVFLLFALLCGVLVWCARDKSPLGPGEGPAVCPQHEVPWPSLADSPWPMYRHDPQLTGRSPYRGPRKGRVKWKFTPGERGLIWPAVVVGLDANVYFGYRQVYPLEEGTFLYAVGADGGVRWRYRLSSRVGLSDEPGPPVVLADGAIVVAYAREHRVFVLNPDGTLRATFGGTFWSLANVGLDGTLYFVGEEGCLWAMSQQGDVKWRACPPGGLKFHWEGVSISPDGNTLYGLGASAPTSQWVSSVWAVGTDGSALWGYPLPDSMGCGLLPVVSCEGNILFATSGYTSPALYCLMPGGSVKWKVEGLSSEWTEPTVDPEGMTLFEIWGSNGGCPELVRVDCSGALLSRQRFCHGGRFPGTYAGPVCDAEGVMYLCTDEVTALDRSGAVMWKVPLEGKSSRIAAPAIGADGTLYLGTYWEHSALYAIE